MSYRIQSGDTLSALAVRFGTTVDALAKANNIANVDLIYTGNTLQIPGQTGDSFEPAAARSSSGSAPSGAQSLGEIPSSFGPAASRLAGVARQTGQRMNSQGWCAKGVADSLAAAGFGGIPRQPSAYMYADVLARDPRFKEVSLTDDQIRQLPPGAVVVSGAYNTPTNPHGHITVTLGGGMESSDHVQSLFLNGTQRVFIPV